MEQKVNTVTLAVAEYDRLKKLEAIMDAAQRGEKVAFKYSRVDNDHHWYTQEPPVHFLNATREINKAKQKANYWEAKYYQSCAEIKELRDKPKKKKWWQKR
jgi:hypothetical protein